MGIQKRLRLVLNNKKCYPKVKTYVFYRKDFWGLLRLKRSYKFRKAIYSILKGKKKFYRILLSQVYKGVKFFVRKYNYRANLFMVKKRLRFFYYRLTDCQIGKLGLRFVNKFGNIVNNFFSIIERRLDVLLQRALYFLLIRESYEFVLLRNVFVNNQIISKPSFLVKVADIVSLNLHPVSAPFFYRSYNPAVDYSNSFFRKLRKVKQAFIFLFLLFFYLLRKREFFKFNLFRKFLLNLGVKKQRFFLVRRVAMFFFKRRYKNVRLRIVFFFVKLFFFLLRFRKKVSKRSLVAKKRFVLKKRVERLGNKLSAGGNLLQGSKSVTSYLKVGAVRPKKFFGYGGKKKFGKTFSEVSRVKRSLKAKKSFKVRNRKMNLRNIRSRSFWFLSKFKLGVKKRVGLRLRFGKDFYSRKQDASGGRDFRKGSVTSKKFPRNNRFGRRDGMDFRGRKPISRLSTESLQLRKKRIVALYGLRRWKVYYMKSRYKYLLLLLQRFLFLFSRYSSLEAYLARRKYFFFRPNFSVRYFHFRKFMRHKVKRFYGYFFGRNRRLFDRSVKKFRFFLISKKLYFRFLVKKLVLYAGYPPYMEVNYKLHKFVIVREPTKIMVRYPFMVNNYLFFNYFKLKGYF